MEIQNPKDLSDSELLSARVQVFREMARLTVYIGLLNEVSIDRCKEDQDATIIPLFSHEH